ncbi:hypothetical protein PsYK624_165470 [Phanerochaete sordida]|uniref:Uncharacterized protein n=1 Tax=Phanerochaete sordida TaxID=48140 RepID=A0A9P3GR13_9APHY|nr:hypothetical protein PsYK624_165470 [Phanerochaete sordida]
MSRAVASLECIELDPTGQMARCRLCVHVGQNHATKWIKLQSVPSHLRSQGHLGAARENQERLNIRQALDTAANVSLNNAEAAERQEAAILRNIPPLRAPLQCSPQRNSSVDDLDFMDELERSGADLDAGILPESRVDWTERLDQQMLNLELYDTDTIACTLGYHRTEFDNSEHSSEEADEQRKTQMAAQEDELAEVFADIDLEGDAQNDMFSGISPSDSQWYPYPNKTIYVLDIIDSLPRLRISESLLKMILWAMRECGAQNVPSLRTFRTLQSSLRDRTGIPTRRYQSPLGHIFYMNDIASIVSQTFSNPSSRPHMRFYPEEPADGTISEVWHGEKWLKGMDPRHLTPMYVAEGKHFYVDEVAQDIQGELLVPQMWIMRGGVLCADARRVYLRSEGLYEIDGQGLVSVAASSLSLNYLDLLERSHPVTRLQCHQPLSALLVRKMPNPLRELANGDPLYTVFIDKWNDDVSGNVSKSYNKHFNTHISIRNLPRSLLQQEYHVHFIGTSQHASPAEQNRAVQTMLSETHTKPPQAYDTATGGICRFRIYPNAGTSDNPMQSEECCHVGQGGNLPCRKCKAGGTQSAKAENEIYHSLFEPGVMRTKQDTRANIISQLRTAVHGVAQHVSDLQTATGTKDRYAQVIIERLLRQYKEMKAENPRLSKEDAVRQINAWVDRHLEELINASLAIDGYDPHCDTPIELLHTVLLGIVKYVWHMSHSSWKDAQKAIFSIRLQSSNVQGLSIPPIRAGYIMNYANSLIGRQLKAVLQTATFHVHGLVPQSHFSLWKAIGELSALLWYPAIRDMEQYTGDLRVATANVLDLFASIDPARIVTKIKLHLLTHSPDDTIRFGPLVGMATEIMESFNSVFRSCSILSNHQAPSRDIAKQLSKLEGAKHRLGGGYWVSSEDGRRIWDGTM